MRWCFDTSALVEPWVRIYPPDMFGPVWGMLKTLAQSGAISAPTDVRLELEVQKDDLLAWSRGLNGFFVDPSRDQVELVAEIVNAHQGIIKPNSQRSGADPFVIALAQINRVPVVTYETAAKSTQAPKIPNVCLARGIRCVTLADVLRAEGFRL